ncbi:MAG: HAD family phosphatase [bacterium]|nr:HAD family phosphatase [bacterium]
MKKYKAIIFDLDGVLVDATEWHYEALNKALGLFGRVINRDDHLKIYNGLPTNRKLEIMSEKGELPMSTHEIIKTMKKKYTCEIINQNCRPNHKKQLLLNHLKNKGYLLACCSNAQKHSVLNMLEMSQIDQYFDQIIGNDEGYKPKPAPDIYLAAFDRLNITATEAIIVEDAPHGIEAAKRSGAPVIEVKGCEDVDLALFAKLNLI